MSEHIERPRGTLDWLPPRVALRQHVVDIGDRGVRARGLPPDRDSRLRGHEPVRAHRRRDLGRRLQGDVHVPRSQRPLADAAPRGHRAGRAGVHRARAGARAAARPALVLRADVPLRRAAGRSLPRALAVRGRGDRVGRPRGRCRGDRGAGRLVPARSDSALSSCTSTRSAIRPAGPPTARRSSPTSSRCATELSPESQERLDRNPMRILDSKDERDQALVQAAPRDLAVPVRRVPSAFRRRARAPHGARGGPRRRRCARARARLLHPDRLGVHPGRRRARAGDDLGRRPLRRARRADRGQADAGRRLRLRCRAARPRARGSAGRAPTLRGCDWFCAVDAPGARPTVGALLDEARGNGLAAEMDLAGRSLKGQLRHARTARSAGRDRHRPGRMGAPRGAPRRRRGTARAGSSPPSSSS